MKKPSAPGYRNVETTASNRTTKIVTREGELENIVRLVESISFVIAQGGNLDWIDWWRLSLSCNDALKEVKEEEE